MQTKTHKRTLFLAQFSILLAIEALFCFTPLGSLPAMGPIVMTTAMIPVVITAIMLGTGAGSLMGAFAGLFSFLVHSFMTPNPLTAFVFTPLYPPGNFWSLVVCFVPRILVGTVAGLVYKGMMKAVPKRDWLAYGLAGLLGSLTNTVGVMGGIWAFFGTKYVQAFPVEAVIDTIQGYAGIAGKTLADASQLPAEQVGNMLAQDSAFGGSVLIFFILFTVLTSGIPEAILSTVASIAVCKPLKQASKRQAGS